MYYVIKTHIHERKNLRSWQNSDAMSLGHTVQYKDGDKILEAMLVGHTKQTTDTASKKTTEMTASTASMQENKSKHTRG